MDRTTLVISASAWITASLGWLLFGWQGVLYGFGAWIALGTVVNLLKGKP